MRVQRFTNLAAKQIFTESKIPGFGFDVEILYISNVLGHKISQVPVEWYKRRAQHSRSGSRFAQNAQGFVYYQKASRQLKEMIFSKYIKDFQKVLKVSDTENFWKRNIALLCISQFIAMMGMNGLVPFLPLFVRDLGIVDEQAARFWSSMIFAGPYFLSVIAVPFWGLLGDRHGQKPMVIRASFGLGIAIFLMGFSQSVEQLFILRVIQGAVSGFIASALAFATKNTPPERSGYAIGLLQSSSSAGVIVGPFLGGLLSDLVGIRPVFFIVALLCIISGICSWVYLFETDKSRELTKSATMRANFNFLKSNKAIFVSDSNNDCCPSRFAYEQPNISVFR